jgi:Cohesin loading factor
LLTIAILNNETYDTDAWLSEAISRRNRLLRLKRYSLLYVSFVGLLRSQMDDTFRCINLLHKLNNDYFPPNQPEDMEFIHLLHLLVGIQNHFTGHLDGAMEYYSRIPPQAGDTYLLALLNKSIILILGPPQHQTIAMKLLDEVERRLIIGGQMSSHLTTAWSFLRGITSTELLRSK